MARTAREGRARGARRGAWAASAAGILFTLAAAPGGAQEDPFLLDGLVVTASPTPRPASAIANSVTVLEGEALRASGQTRVLEALRTVPGLAVVQNGAAGATTSVFFRGAESDHVLVLVDGVQVNQPGGSFDFSGLLLDNVERIEVLRGGASALYGSDAMAGVIHVITRAGGEGFGASAEARAGTYGRRDWSVRAHGGRERLGYALSVARTSGDGLLAFNNGHVNSVFSGTVRFAPDAATRGRVSVRVGDRRYHFPTDGSGSVVDRNAFTFGDESTVGVQVARRVVRGVELEALLSHHETDGGTDDAPDGPADTLGFFAFSSLDHVRRSSAEVRANLRGSAGAATLGFELEEQRQRSFSESASQFGTSPARSEYRRDNRAAYVHLVSGGRVWSANAGARLEDNERYGRSVTWQLGAVWSPLPAARLRAAAGRAIKEPTFFETFASGFATGNPELDPERATSWELGVDVTLPRGTGRLSTTWFDQRMRDLIQYTFTPPVTGGPNYHNVAEASSRGVEASWEVGRSGWRLRAGWSWLDTEVVDPGFAEGPDADFVPGEALLRRPAHTLSLAGHLRAGSRATVTASVRSVGARDDRDFSSFPAVRVRLERYTLVGVGVELRAFDAEQGRPGLVLLVRGDNLFDRAYEEVAGFPAAGRSFLIGARLDLGGG